MSFLYPIRSSYPYHPIISHKAETSQPMLTPLGKGSPGILLPSTHSLLLILVHCCQNSQRQAIFHGFYPASLLGFHACWRPSCSLGIAYLFLTCSLSCLLRIHPTFLSSFLLKTRVPSLQYTGLPCHAQVSLESAVLSACPVPTSFRSHLLQSSPWSPNPAWAWSLLPLVPLAHCGTWLPQPPPGGSDFSD